MEATTERRRKAVVDSVARDDAHPQRFRQTGRLRKRSPAAAGRLSRRRLAGKGIPSHDWHVSKVEQMEAELRKLSQAELRQIREWLDDMIEDDLDFTPEFERSIQQAERDMANEKSARVREPEGS
jgi:hypothetical protein